MVRRPARLTPVRACIVIVCFVVGCGTDEQEPIDAGAAPTSPFRRVLVDPADPASLVVSVGCIRIPAPQAPPVIDVTETEQQVLLGLVVPVLDPPCNPVQVDVELDGPLAGREVIDESGVTLEVGTVVPHDPARLVPADCTTDAARAAVANDVDGGLRSDLVGCLDGWMAVTTSTDACPATGEAPEPGCVGNVHTGYWWDEDGHWTLAGFDCENLRRQYPGPPAALCEPKG